MVHTIEAVADEEGRIRLAERPARGTVRRALVTILDEPPLVPADTAILSEAALQDDWCSPQEDAAWSHLQRAR
jgi:hypothetical protein